VQIPVCLSLPATDSTSESPELFETTVQASLLPEETEPTVDSGEQADTGISAITIVLITFAAVIAALLLVFVVLLIRRSIIRKKRKRRKQNQRS
jgi:cytochrome bd-type quinol oxidase subunit 1